jgi:NAD(P)-dependent dehydrogenase (short-subunit alcohol dehydrogenase family)
MDSQKLAGKVALITGGGRGIGAAIAAKLATSGASTVVCGRTQSHIDQAASRISSAGGHAEAIAADVSDWKSVSALAEKVQQAHGKLDILVNNAGIGG